jgi:tetratricopeptide (TPR) repeat protein
MYTFKHILIQEVAYHALPPARKQAVHERTAPAIETLAGDRVAERYGELAHHYSRCDNTEKAVAYLQRAGQQAAERSAYQEAIAHLTRGLELLRTLPDAAERAQQERGLQSALSLALTVTKGWTAREVGHVYTRARELCQQVGEPLQLFPVLRGLWAFHLMQGDLHIPRELGEQLLRLAQRVQAPAFLSEAHYALGAPLYFLGEFALAREHLEQGIALYDPQQQGPLALLYGSANPRVSCLSRLALTLWYLGYPDRAAERIHEMLTLTQELSHPFSLAWALSFSAIVHQCRRGGQATHERAEALLALSNPQGFAAYIVQGGILRAGRWPSRGTEKRASCRYGRAWMPTRRCSQRSCSRIGWPCSPKCVGKWDRPSKG